MKHCAAQELLHFKEQVKELQKPRIQDRFLSAKEESEKKMLEKTVKTKTKEREFKMPIFNIDELTLIKMYTGFTMDRDKTIQAIEESLPYTEDEEIKKRLQSVVRKVKAMTTEDFAKIDLSKAMEVPIYPDQFEQFE